MRKRYDENEINQIKKELLNYRAKFVKLADIFRDYESTHGNAYTYIRKLGNVIKYGDE